MTTDYHITFETPTHFGQADVQVDYKYDCGDADDPLGGDYAPVGQFYYDNILLTDKVTGKSENHGEDMPDGIDNIVRDAADEQFKVE